MNDDRYRIISMDPWGKRDGEIMRIFNSRYDLS